MATYRGLPNRSRSSKGKHVPPLPTLHLELWVALRKDRMRISRIIRKTYRIARRITLARGGHGPWAFLVDHDPTQSKTPRLRSILGLRPEEDLWVELAYYPNKVRMKNIIRRIWKQPNSTRTPPCSTVSFPKGRLVIRRQSRMLHSKTSSSLSFTLPVFFIKPMMAGSRSGLRAPENRSGQPAGGIK